MIKIVSVRNLVVGTCFILLFLYFTFEPQMSASFMFIILIGAFAYITDKHPVITLEKPGSNRFMLVVYGLGAYVAFIAVSYVVLGFLGYAGVAGVSPANIYAEWIGSLMAQFSPALADNPWLTLVAWGVLIPIAETFAFFGMFFEWFTEIFKANILRKDFKMWLVVFGMAGVFTLFHITAKGLGNNAALTMTYIFGLVSLLLVVYTGQLLPAIILHLITNTTAIVQQLNLLPQIGSPFVLAVGAAVVLYFLLRNVRLENRRFLLWH